MHSRLVTFVLLLCVVGMTAGCLPIPLLPSGQIHSLEDDIEELVDKSATKSEVIENLGNPLKYSKTSMSYKACGKAAGFAYILCVPLACTGGDLRSSECVELLLEFDNKSRLITYQEIPWQEDYSSVKDDINLLKLADQSDNVARRLWEESSTYRYKLTSGNGATQVKGLAAEGDAEVQLQLYWNDLSVDVGLKWLCRAADQGHREARTQLGKLYQYGSQKFFQLGKLYQYGSQNIYFQRASIQIDSDYPKACMWFHLAGKAQIYDKLEEKDNQSVLLPYDSAEVERTAKIMTAYELKKAKILIRDWEPGQCDRDLFQYLGDEYVEDSGMVGLCAAAEKNSMSSREALGRIYYFGSNDVEPDLPRAYMWYHLAARAYVRPSITKSAIQLFCNDMTREQRSIAVRLLEKWEPGQCEIDLLGAISGENE